MSNYYPSLEEVKELSGQGNLIPLYREINADLETPVSAYLKIAQPPYSFLLESVEGGERLARYSFIGTEPFHVIKTGLGQPDGEVDPLVLIQEMLEKYTHVPIQGLPRFHGVQWAILPTMLCATSNRFLRRPRIFWDFQRLCFCLLILCWFSTMFGTK